MRTTHRTVARQQRSRRDRHGRGLRGRLVPDAVPLSRNRGELFDGLVLDAIEELEEHWTGELGEVQFSVEDVPPEASGLPDFDPEFVIDRGVALGRLYRGGTAEMGSPVIVVYRRPIESRALSQDDRGDIVFTVVAELAAELLGRDIDEIN